jgi:hypothetical protein
MWSAFETFGLAQCNLKRLLSVSQATFHGFVQEMLMLGAY